MATYPGAVKSFTALNTGDTIQDTDVEAAYDEITALEQELVTSGLTNPLKVNANIVFPATQVLSAGVNTLDDYEEGTWTPTITFDTPGNLSVAFSTQLGSYTKVGRWVTVTIRLITSTFTHTTASGGLRIGGAPFSAAATLEFAGPLVWQGITKANYTDINLLISGGSASISLQAMGSAQTIAAISASDMPTGGSVILQGSISYIV